MSLRFDMNINPEALYKAGMGKFDANETGLFARQLEQIATKTYNVEYPQLKARQLKPAAHA